MEFGQSSDDQVEGTTEHDLEKSEERLQKTSCMTEYCIAGTITALLKQVDRRFKTSVDCCWYNTYQCFPEVD